MNAENFITINGRQLTFESGETILDVAKRNNIFIPTLCHLPGARPTGACRVCVVEVAGARSLVASCTMPASPKMVINTHSPVVLDARKSVIELLLSSGNHNCSARNETSEKWAQLQDRAADYDKSEELCEVYGTCKLQALAYRYQVDSSRFAGREPEYALEDASDLILRDFSRCILCGRCVQACNDAQVNNAISYGFRGTKGKIVAMGDASLEKGECVFCGECISACPVGALVEKKTRYALRPWEVEHASTTCNYCGVGCQLDLQIADNGVKKVESIPGGANDGRLCMKGRFGFGFLEAPQRITKPQIRENGALRDASWDEALKVIADKINEVKKAHGADAIAGVTSGKSTNEALYLAQKMFRGAIGTNNITTPYAAAGMTNSADEVEQAPVILLIGSDIEAEAPMMATLIKRAVKHNDAKLIVVSDKRNRIAGFATEFIQVAIGSEGTLACGLLGQLLQEKSNKGVAEAKKIVEAHPLDTVLSTTGAAKDALERAAKILCDDTPAMLLYGRNAIGAVNVFNLIQQLLGNLDRKHGGVNQVAELNNATGAALMGAVPNYLPGYKSIDDVEARTRYEQAWGATLSDKPGLNYGELLARIVAGNDIKVLYTIGEDVAVSGAGAGDLKTALAKLDFIVQQDYVTNETTAYADVVLPAAVWVEADGSYLSNDRRRGLVTAAITPPGEAKPETWIFTEIANRCDQCWPTRTAQAIWDEEIQHLLSLGEAEVLVGGKAPQAFLPGVETLNYHHHRMLELCDGMMSSIPTAKGGSREWAGDLAKADSAFVKVLEADGLMDKKAPIDEVLAQYQNHRGGLIPVLQKVQAIMGFLPIEVQNYIGLHLGLPPSDVFGVVTFYSFFTMVARGKYVIRVCLGTACYVKGAGKILEAIEDDLKIKCGETTDDRIFSLEGVRCVGACGLAPVVVVGEDTHGMIDPAKSSDILTNYRSASNEA
jgi:predicted molibdopterin-dependent oxidoreductase YjgC/NADH:ubiquinone oxidoreductase subunit E